MSKTPIVLIAVILLSSINSACYSPTKHKYTKNCHIHTDQQGVKEAKHCHDYRNGLQHQHPYRYRSL